MYGSSKSASKTLPDVLEAAAGRDRPVALALFDFVEPVGVVRVEGLGEQRPVSERSRPHLPPALDPRDERPAAIASASFGIMQRPRPPRSRVGLAIRLKSSPQWTPQSIRGSPVTCRERVDGRTERRPRIVGAGRHENRGEVAEIARAFQSQFNPHPPAMYRGIPSRNLSTARPWHTCRRCARWISAAAILRRRPIRRPAL